MIEVGCADSSDLVAATCIKRRMQPASKGLCHHPLFVHHSENATAEDTRTWPGEFGENCRSAAQGHGERLTRSRNFFSTARRPVLISCPYRQTIQPTLRDQTHDAFGEPVENHPPVVDGHVMRKPERTCTVA